MIGIDDEENYNDQQDASLITTKNKKDEPTYAYAINLPSPTTRPSSADRHKTAELGWCGRASGNRHARKRVRALQVSAVQGTITAGSTQEQRGSYKADVRKPARVRVGGGSHNKHLCAGAIGCTAVSRASSCFYAFIVL